MSYFAAILFLSLAACAGKTHTPEFSLRSPSEASVTNPGIAEINDASVFSQVVAVSDVHGMYDNLLVLLRAGKVIDANNNWIAGKTLVVVTGDSIDKGPKSIEVLNLWVRLQNQAPNFGGQVIHVLGNHEAEFLADPEDSSKAAELLAEMTALNIPLSDLTTTTSPRGLFLHTEPLAARVGRWLFCHSGFYPDMNWADFSNQAQQVLGKQNYQNAFLIGSNSILESKKWELDTPTVNSLLARLNSIGLYGVVFGHQPGAFGIKGRSAVKAQGRLIKIDNGMAPEAGANSGSLLVFTNPQQMNQTSFPQVKVIFPNGSEKSLSPE